MGICRYNLDKGLKVGDQMLLFQLYLFAKGHFAVRGYTEGWAGSLVEGRWRVDESDELHMPGFCTA